MSINFLSPEVNADSVGAFLRQSGHLSNNHSVSGNRKPMKTNFSRLIIAVLCMASLYGPRFTFAQKQSAPPAKPFELSVDSIMRGPRLVGYPPTGVYWSQDSQRVYFRWKQADEPRLKETSLYVVNREGSGLRRLTEDEAKQAPPANGELSKDK